MSDVITVRGALLAARAQLELLGDKTLLGTIDEALKLPDPSETKPENTDDQLFESLIKQAEDRRSHITNLTVELYHLPDKIKAKELEILELSIARDKLFQKSAKIELKAKEQVLEDGLAKNDNDRRIAKEKKLESNSEYQDVCKRHDEQDYALKVAMIDLSFLHNQQKSFLAVAALQGK